MKIYNYILKNDEENEDHFENHHMVDMLKILVITTIFGLIVIKRLQVLTSLGLKEKERLSYSSKSDTYRLNVNGVG